jgi:hypothetical protein
VNVFPAAHKSSAGLDAQQRPTSIVSAAAGIISLLLLISTIPILPPIPAFGASQDQIVSFYSTYVTRGYLYQFIAAVALLSALWFLAYLYTRLRHETPESPLPIIMLASGTVWVAVAFVYLGLFQIFSTWASQPLMHPVLRALSDAYVLGFMFSVVPSAVTVLAASLSIQPNAGWPRWLKHLAVPVLAVEVLGCVPLIFPDTPLKAGGPITYASVFAVVLWISLASLTAIRTERTRTYTPHESR